MTKEFFFASLDPGAKIIPLFNNQGFTVVSSEDFERLAGIRFCLDSDGYAVFSAGEYQTQSGKSAHGHPQIAHLIISVPSGFEPDHINREKLDNRRCNLRIATRRQQLGNISKLKHGRTSKFKGVSWKANLFVWRANCCGQYLGCFTSEIDAALAYNTAASKAFGEFAILNQI